MKSLSVQLLRVLFPAQIASILVAMAAWMAFSPYVTYEDAAAANLRSVLQGALVAGPDGHPAIATSVALQSYRSERPQLRYAILEKNGRTVPGSSDAVASYVKTFAPVLPHQGALDFKDPKHPGAGLVLVVAEQTRFGELIFASIGNEFRLSDILALFTVYFPGLVLIFVPAILAAVVVLPLSLRIGLRELRSLSARAETITLDSLDVRLPTRGVAREIRPLVDALNALLARLQTAVGQQRRFAANAAHELRTPFAILSARIDSLQEGERRTELQRDVRRAGLLIDQLLAATRTFNQPDRLTMSVDVVRIVSDIIADCAPLAFRSGREIELHCQYNSLLVRADPQALKSALSNLIDNALRMEPFGGCVDVCIEIGEGRGHARIVVTDHGCGVAAEDRDQVFEAFWRKNDDAPGSGLGLAIAREIALAHGGTLEIRETKGGGATFVFALPMTGGSPLECSE